MKKIVLWILNATVCVSLVSCSQSASYEAQADKAYNQSKKVQGYEKKMLEKRAYIFYQRVLKAEPDPEGHARVPGIRHPEPRLHGPQ